LFANYAFSLCADAGWILIDRCGKHFGTILNYLRDGSVPLPDNCKEVAELLAEVKYYCIADLIESCEMALMKREREAEPICRVPLITSQKEEHILINSTAKVKFVFHIRENN
jgi:BTB/POZ domain-containing adapter for CUL3-mediated RhoA degradation protein